MCRLLGHDIVKVAPEIVNLPYGLAREEIEKRAGKKVTFLRIGDSNGHFFVLTATNKKEINKILKMRFRICKTCGVWEKKAYYE